jgi:hypothetical protein
MLYVVSYVQTKLFMTIVAKLFYTSKNRKNLKTHVSNFYIVAWANQYTFIRILRGSDYKNIKY